MNSLEGEAPWDRHLLLYAEPYFSTLIDKKLAGRHLYPLRHPSIATQLAHFGATIYRRMHLVSHFGAISPQKETRRILQRAEWHRRAHLVSLSIWAQVAEIRRRGEWHRRAHLASHSTFARNCFNLRAQLLQPLSVRALQVQARLADKASIGRVKV